VYKYVLFSYEHVVTADGDMLTDAHGVPILIEATAPIDHQHTGMS
jgi:hypothetical protein